MYSHRTNNATKTKTGSVSTQGAALKHDCNKHVRTTQDYWNIQADFHHHSWLTFRNRSND